MLGVRLPAGRGGEGRRLASKKQWMPKRVTPRPGKASDADKHAIVTACERFIADILKPRFLPDIRPTEWNYVVDIHGAWHAGRYRFMQRYRSGMAHCLAAEFDTPFARIDYMSPDNFNIHWMRHTGQWWPVYRGKTLAEALHILETDPVLLPF